MKIYEIKNDSGLRFSVQKTTPYLKDGNTRKILPEEITFLIDDTEDPGAGEVISISKEEARKLAKELMRIVEDSEPELNSLGLPKSVSRDPNHPKTKKLNDKLVRYQRYGNK